MKTLSRAPITNAREPYGFAIAVALFAMLVGCSKPEPVDLGAEIDLSPSRKVVQEPQSRVPTNQSPVTPPPVQEPEPSKQPQAPQEAAKGPTGGSEAGGAGAERREGNTGGVEASAGDASNGGPVPNDAVLPGGAPSAPALSPKAAAASAGRLLQQAQDALRRGDRGAASEAALAAYDQVVPHASADPKCSEIRDDLEKVLEAAGSNRGAESVPTRFE